MNIVKWIFIRKVLVNAFHLKNEADAFSFVVIIVFFLIYKKANKQHIN